MALALTFTHIFFALDLELAIEPTGDSVGRPPPVGMTSPESR